MADNQLKIATFNANSIRVRLPQILDWIEREQADVLAVQETKVRDEDFPTDDITDQGYHVVYRGQKSHAGVAVITREEPDDVTFGFDSDENADEVRLVRLKIQGVSVVNTYGPQGRDIEHEMFEYKLEWFDRLKRLFDRHHDPVDDLIWLGDMNVAPEPIDIYDPDRHAEHVDFHPKVRERFHEACEWGFVDVFRKHHPDEPDQYTYYDYRARDPVERGVGWRVDHILATGPLAERCTDAWIDREARLVERPSDHTFLVAVFDL